MPNVFTYQAGSSCSRLDRIYVSMIMQNKITSTACLASAFSDHCLVQCAFKNTLENVYTFGRASWKFNWTSFKYEEAVEDFKTEWEKLIRRRRQYSNILDWWTSHVKPALKRFFLRKQKERKKEVVDTLNFFYISLNK